MARKGVCSYYFGTQEFAGNKYLDTGNRGTYVTDPIVIDIGREDTAAYPRPDVYKYVIGSDYDLKTIQNLKFWFKGDTGVILEGTDPDIGQVAIWQDQSGLSNHLTQTNASNRPFYSNDRAINGIPGILAAGNQWLNLTQRMSGRFVNSPFTLIWVGKTNANTTTTTIAEAYTSNGGIRFTASPSSHASIIPNAGTQVYSFTNTNQPTYHIARANWPYILFTDNHNPEVTFTFNKNATLLMYNFIAIFNGTFNNKAIDYSANEIIFFNRFLSNEEIDEIKSYLEYRYDLNYNGKSSLGVQKTQLEKKVLKALSWNYDNSNYKASGHVVYQPDQNGIHTPLKSSKYFVRFYLKYTKQDTINASTVRKQASSSVDVEPGTFDPSVIDPAYPGCFFVYPASGGNGSWYCPTSNDPNGPAPAPGCFLYEEVWYCNSATIGDNTVDISTSFDASNLPINNDLNIFSIIGRNNANGNYSLVRMGLADQQGRHNIYMQVGSLSGGIATEQTILDDDKQAIKISPNMWYKIEIGLEDNSITLKVNNREQTVQFFSPAEYNVDFIVDPYSQNYNLFAGTELLISDVVIDDENWIDHGYIHAVTPDDPVVSTNWSGQVSSQNNLLNVLSKKSVGQDPITKSANDNLNYFSQIGDATLVTDFKDVGQLSSSSKLNLPYPTVKSVNILSKISSDNNGSIYQGTTISSYGAGLLDPGAVWPETIDNWGTSTASWQDYNADADYTQPIRITDGTKYAPNTNSFSGFQQLYDSQRNYDKVTYKYYLNTDYDNATSFVPSTYLGQSLMLLEIASAGGAVFTDILAETDSYLYLQSDVTNTYTSLLQATDSQSNNSNILAFLRSSINQSADAIIKATFSNYYLTDSKLNYEKIHGTTAKFNNEKRQDVVSKLNKEVRHTVTAETATGYTFSNLHLTQTIAYSRRGRAHASNLRKYLRVNRQFITNTRLKKQTHLNHDLIGLNKSLNLLPYTVNSYKILTANLSNLSNSLLKETTALSLSTDYLLYKRSNISTQSNSQKIRANSLESTTGNQLRLTASIGTAADTLNKASFSETFSTNSYKLKQNIANQNTNYYLRSTNSLLNGTNTVTLLQSAINHKFDSINIALFKLTHETDSLIYSRNNKSYSSDVIKLLNTTNYFGTEAPLFQRSSHDYSSNILKIAKANIATSTNIKTLLRSSKTSILDSLLIINTRSEYDTDTLKIIEIIKNIEISSLLLKSGFVSQSITSVKYLQLYVSNTTNDFLFLRSNISSLTAAFKVGSCKLIAFADSIVSDISSLLHFGNVAVIKENPIDQSLNSQLCYRLFKSYDTQSSLFLESDHEHHANAINFSVISNIVNTSTFLQSHNTVDQTADSIKFNAYSLETTERSFLQLTSVLAQSVTSVKYLTSNVPHTTKSFSSLSSLKTQFSNALLLNNNFIDVFSNAFLLNASADYFSTSAFLRSSPDISTTSDLLALSSYKVSFDLDSFLFSFSKIFNRTGSYIKGSFDYKSFTSSIFRLNTGFSQFLSGFAFIRIAQPLLTDSYLQGTFVQSQNINSNVYNVYESYSNTDSFKSQAFVSSSSSDSLKIATVPLYYFTDAYFIAGFSKTFNTEPFLTDLNAVVNFTRSLVKKTITFGFTVDTFKYVSVDLGHNADYLASSVGSVFSYVAAASIGELNQEHMLDLVLSNTIINQSTAGSMAIIFDNVNQNLSVLPSFSSVSSGTLSVPSGKEIRDYIATNRKILKKANWGTLDIAERIEDPVIIIPPPVISAEPLVEFSPFSAGILPAELPLTVAENSIVLPVKKKSFGANNNPFKRANVPASLTKKNQQDGMVICEISPVSTPIGVAPSVVSVCGNLPKKLKRLQNNGMPSRRD